MSEVTARAALLVATGAVLGALARWLLGVWLTRDFPYGTLTANALGSYLIGLVVLGGLLGGWLGDDARLFLGVGLLGAFTTMSSFAYDTVAFLEAAKWRLAALNLVANPVLSVVAAYAGLVTARLLRLAG
jgi:CrcB protein